MSQCKENGLHIIELTVVQAVVWLLLRKNKLHGLVLVKWLCHRQWCSISCLITWLDVWIHFVLTSSMKLNARWFDFAEKSMGLLSLHRYRQWYSLKVTNRCLVQDTVNYSMPSKWWYRFSAECSSWKTKRFSCLSQWPWRCSIHISLGNCGEKTCRLIMLMNFWWFCVDANRNKILIPIILQRCL